MTYTDEDLIAFLDGTASEELAVSIETELAGDTDLEVRLRRLDPLSVPVSDAFSHLEGPAENAVDLPAINPEARAGSLARFLPLVAAALLGAVVATALMPPSPDAADWRVQVANYQALYGERTVSATQFSSEELAEQTTVAGQEIGLAGLATVPELANGLTHVRTQILQIDGVPLAQIVFRTDDGVPVALCGLPRDSVTAVSEIGVGSMSKMRSASFDTDSHSWLLIGGKDSDLIVENAKLFQSALEGLDA